jgi:molybdate transport system regulatory protein
MNKIKGKITEIESDNYISIVGVDTEIGKFYSLIVETPKTANYLKIGNKVNLLFKETEVEILRNCFFEKKLNTFEGKISKINTGKVLSKVFIKVKNLNITSVSATKGIELLEVKENENINFYIKPNEIVIEAL